MQAVLFLRALGLYAVTSPDDYKVFLTFLGVQGSRIA